MPIGKTLREARQRQGLSLRELEDSTKIRTHYLQSLEEENFSELPGQTYVMGFIRTYARALGLDPQDLVNQYKATVGEPESVIKPMDPVAPPINKKTFPTQRIIVIAGLCVLAVLTLYGMDKASKGGKAQSPPVEQATKAPGVAKPEQPTPQPQTPSAQQPSTQPPTQAPATNPSTAQDSSGLSLDITFNDKCWLIIKADGQEVFQGTVPAGQTKNIKAKDKIEFPTIGNAQALQLTLNGKPLPPMAGTVVKNKTLTKSDIPQ